MPACFARVFLYFAKAVADSARPTTPAAAPQIESTDREHSIVHTALELHPQASDTYAATELGNEMDHATPDHNSDVASRDRVHTRRPRLTIAQTRKRLELSQSSHHVPITSNIRTARPFHATHTPGEQQRV